MIKTSKAQKIGLIGTVVLMVLLLVVILISISKAGSGIAEITTEIVEVEKIIIQDNMLNKLMDEPGLNYWNIVSFDDNIKFYLTIEFKSTEGTTIKVTRRFDSPNELNENIELILKEARKLK